MAAAKNEALTLEQVQAQIAGMLAEAKAEAAKIVADAKAQVKGGESPVSAEERAAQEAHMNELVDVKLFKDNDKYKEPVFVAVNGESIAIERGVRVKIKRKFAEVLDNSDNQDYETALLIEAKSSEGRKAIEQMA